MVNTPSHMSSASKSQICHAMHIISKKSLSAGKNDFSVSKATFGSHC